MRILGKVVFFISFRLSFLVAKWRLAWSYWNTDGKHNQNQFINWIK